MPAVQAALCHSSGTEKNLLNTGLKHTASKKKFLYDISNLTSQKGSNVGCLYELLGFIRSAQSDNLSQLKKIKNRNPSINCWMTNSSLPFCCFQLQRAVMALIY